MMPSVIIINDNQASIAHNPELHVLAYRLKSTIRVYIRSSFEGEQLYDIREGVLFIDESGHRQRIWKDEYSSVEQEIASRISKLPDRSLALLKKYQLRQQ